MQVLVHITDPNGGSKSLSNHHQWWISRRDISLFDWCAACKCCTPTHVSWSVEFSSCVWFWFKGGNIMSCKHHKEQGIIYLCKWCTTMVRCRGLVVSIGIFVASLLIFCLYCFNTAWPIPSYFCRVKSPFKARQHMVKSSRNRLLRRYQSNLHRVESKRWVPQNGCYTKSERWIRWYPNFDRHHFFCKIPIVGVRSQLVMVKSPFVVRHSNLLPTGYTVKFCNH